MGINLGGIEVFVSEDLFKHTDINTILIHKRSRRMTQFMNGNSFTGKSAGFKAVVDYLFDTAVCDAVATFAYKQSFFLRVCNGFSCFGVLGNSIDSLLVEIDDTFLVAFAQNLHGKIFYIRL